MFWHQQIFGRKIYHTVTGSHGLKAAIISNPRHRICLTHIEVQFLYLSDKHVTYYTLYLHSVYRLQ